MFLRFIQPTIIPARTVPRSITPHSVMMHANTAAYPSRLFNVNRFSIHLPFQVRVELESAGFSKKQIEAISQAQLSPQEVNLFAQKGYSERQIQDFNDQLIMVETMSQQVSTDLDHDALPISREDLLESIVLLNKPENPSTKPSASSTISMKI